MKNFNKIILFTFVSFTFFAVNAQNIDYSQIDEKTLRQLNQLASINDSTTKRSPKTKEEMIELKESELEEKYQDEDNPDKQDDQFGYLGRQDFLAEARPKIPDDKKPLIRFGYDYFSKAPTTFAPLSDIPIPSDYLLGPGDEINILLYGNTNRDYLLEVTRDGDIFIPEVGPISVAGTTFNDLKTTLNEIISSTLIGTSVSVSLGELRSINIFVLGEAFRPGIYTVGSLSTMTNAIFASGGIKSSGSLRNIELKRNGNTVSNYDLYELLLKGNSKSDQRLMSGDIIFIPPVSKTVAIDGEVNRAGIYELLENEKIQDLLTYSGGLKPKADKSKAEIIRIDKSRSAYTIEDIDLNSLSESNSILEDGDTLSVYSISEGINNAILVRGHTKRPGFISWKEGLRIGDIFSSTDDLLPLTDLKYVLVQRDQDSNNIAEYRHINIGEVHSNNDSAFNMPLLERDVITFFPEKSFCEIIKLEKELEEIKRLEEEKKELDSLYSTSEKDQSMDLLNENRILSLQDLSSSTQKDSVTEDLEDTCRLEILRPIITRIENSTINGEPHQLVRVLGNVMFPGSYPLTVKATLNDIINAAGNIDDLSYTDEIEIIRNKIKDKKIVQEIISGSFEEMKKISMEPLDLVTVKKIKTDINTANVDGMVLFPGEYVIQDDETLLSLIDRAGGFSGDVDTSGIVLIRKDLIESQRQTLNLSKAKLQKQFLVLQTKEENSGENTELLSKINELSKIEVSDEALGRLVFDFEEIKNRNADDLLLTNGDRIIIPKRSQTVTVIGEVYAPNSHIFNPNLGIDDYINASGGLNNFGDESNIYIIRNNGSVIPVDKLSKTGFFRGTASNIERGDTIVIPLEIKDNTNLRAANEITQIIYQLAVATAAIQSF